MITFYMYIWQVFIHGILYVGKVRLKVLPLRLKFVIINKLNFVSSWFSFVEIISNERICVHYKFIVPTLDIFKIAYNSIVCIHPSSKFIWLFWFSTIKYFLSIL